MTNTEPTSPRLDARPRALVIDDEPQVARVLSRVLSKDCEVTVETNPTEACRRLMVAPEDFDVIFCDMMMPGMTREQLYHRVVRVHPLLAQRFVLMTGGAFGAECRRFLEVVDAPLVRKPFDIANLRLLTRRLTNHAVGAATRVGEAQLKPRSP